MLRASNLGIWGAWTMATAISGSLALVLAAYFVHIVLPSAYFSSSVGLSGDNLIPHYVVWSVGLLALAGPLIGISQGLVLLALVHYKEWHLWAVASCGGVFVSIVLN